MSVAVGAPRGTTDGCEEVFVTDLGGGALKLAIMQPYFFPYIGYFQLINAVDRFVFYDDVNFIKGGWINRNRLFLAGSIRYVTVPLLGASSFEKINKIHLQPSDGWAKSILSSVRQSYSKAPYYKKVYELLENVLNSHDGYLSCLARNSVVAVLNYLDVEKELVLSSDVYGNEERRGVDRVLDICKFENADEYWNLPGGVELYDVSEFKQSGVDLRFVDVSLCQYPQFDKNFIPGLSILDVLMFNSAEKVKCMLSRSLV